MQPPATNEIRAACRLIAELYQGPAGLWAYEGFDYINATLFDHRLPQPFIQWAITPHGGCLGLTAHAAQPVITLHPALLKPQQKESPWGIDAALLGPRYAFDVLIHEAIHVSVKYVLGGATGPTSHNNPQWISEVNRLAPLLGLDIEAGQSRTQRVPIEGHVTATGKPQTRVQRITTGSVPFKAITRFPRAVRAHLEQLDYYRHRESPFPTSIVL